MEKFIRVDDDYINVKYIVKIEESMSGDTDIYIATSDLEDSIYRVSMETDEVMELIVEAQSDVQHKVAKKVTKKATKNNNKFAHIDVEGLF